MIKKIVSLILTFAVCFSVSSCMVRRSGKPYIEDRSQENFADGMTFSVERKQTDNFIAYQDLNGKVMLYPVNEKKYHSYDPEGLCNVKPGEIYKITYDAQIVTGGIAGRNDRYFLAVYKCKKGDYKTLFENGYYQNGYSWDSSRVIMRPCVKGSDFLAFRNPDSSYEVFTKERGKTHYDRAKEVKFKVDVSDKKESSIEIEINVLCQSDISDEYIIEHVTKRLPYDESEFLFIDCDHPDYLNSAGDNDYDSIEKFASGKKFHHHLFYYKTDEKPSKESKRLITFEEMSTKTAEELGLDKELYTKIAKTWNELRDGNYYYSDNPFSREHAMNCDVLIFTGDYGGQAWVCYDKDLNLYINDSWFDYENHPTKRYQCLVLFIRHEFNEMFPQA